MSPEKKPPSSCGLYLKINRLEWVTSVQLATFFLCVLLATQYWVYCFSVASFFSLVITVELATNIMCAQFVLQFIIFSNLNVSIITVLLLLLSFLHRMEYMLVILQPLVLVSNSVLVLRFCYMWLTSPTILHWKEDMLMILQPWFLFPAMFICWDAAVTCGAHPQHFCTHPGWGVAICSDPQAITAVSAICTFVISYEAQRGYCHNCRV